MIERKTGKTTGRRVALRWIFSCLSVVILLGLSSPHLSSAKMADRAVVGDWTTIDDDTGEARGVIRISEERGRLSGKIIKLILDPEEDSNPLCHECEGERKNQPIIGMTVIWDLVRDGDAWSGGRILDPENGQTYRCIIRLVEDSRALDVRGYIGIRLFGRSQRWIRAE